MSYEVSPHQVVPRQLRVEPTLPRAFGFTAAGALGACSIPVAVASLYAVGLGGWASLAGALVFPSMVLWMAVRRSPVYLVAYLSGGFGAIGLFLIWLVHEIATTPWFTF